MERPGVVERSIHSAMAIDSFNLGPSFSRLSSSICMVPDNDSMGRCRRSRHSPHAADPGAGPDEFAEAPRGELARFNR